MRIVFFLIAVVVSVVSYAQPRSRIKFIENKNQWKKGVDFVSRIPGGSMHIRPGGFSYYLLDEKRMDEFHLESHAHGAVTSESNSSIMIDGVRVNVNFVGANLLSVPQGISQSKEYYNYFLGSDPGAWASKVYAYEGMLYPSIYSGVDLKIYATGENVKYDFIVAPGEDPSQIRIAWDGADQLALNSGDLYAKTRLGDIIEKDPVAYQFINGAKTIVSCEFALDDGVVSFVFPDGYDSCHPLTIDPLLIFSTFSGSAADNWGSTATPGEKGRLYSGGITSHNLTDGQSEFGFSGTFPASSGAFQVTYGGEFDVAIFKYDSLGENILYASYLGGNHCESPHSLIVNDNNELVIFGTTESTNFPTTTTAFKRTFSGGHFVNSVFIYENGTDIFVTKISADGTKMLGSTYLGGSANDGGNFIGSELRKNYGDDLRGDVITDEQGNIYLSTVAESSGLATLNPYQGGFTDALLVKLAPDLSQVIWSRYLGGTGTDAAHTIKFSNDHIYVAGGTTSTNFPTTPNAAQPTHAGPVGGGVDGWIAELSLDGQTIFNATYTGSDQFDMVYFLDVNASGEVYVYGQTDGDRPIFPADIYRDENSGQFLQKFTSDLSESLFYTVFGSGKGSPDISPTAFLVNDCNNLYMAGWGGPLNLSMDGGNPFSTSTLPLTVTEDAYQKTTLGHDFYLMVMSPDAKEKLYATFLGGNSRTHVDGGTSRFDKQGVVYHAVCAGCGNNDNFPTTPTAVSRTNNSINCNNAAFKFDLSLLKARVRIKGLDHVCIPEHIVFENISLGGERFYWNFGDGTPIIEQTDPLSISHFYPTPGTYTVWLKAFDPGTCQTSDSVSVSVVVGIADAEFPQDAPMCEGDSHTLTASGGVSYEWISTDGKYNFNTPSITVSPEDTTKFYITVLEAAGCLSRDSVMLNVVPKINPDFSFERKADCLGESGLVVKNLTDSLFASDQVLFDFGDGSTSDLEEAEHLYEEAGVYNVKLITTREMCAYEKIVPLAFGPLKYPNIITPGVLDDKNDAFVIQYGDEPGPSPADYGYRTSIIIFDRWGRKVYENNDYKSDWSGGDLANGVYYFEISIEEHTSCKGWVHLVK